MTEQGFYDKVHDTIGGMTEWERGWYHAAIHMVFWNGTEEDFEDGEVRRHRLPLDYIDGQWIIARYSPSGSQKGSEGFYAPDPPPADDLVTIVFDPEKWRSVWVELDSEAAISYYALEYHHGQFTDELVCVSACTESDKGLPSSWEVWPDNTKED